jgi:hypothetical protein
MNVALRPEASSDLVSAAAYFNDGWGDHFLDTIGVDLDDLGSEAGIHAIHYGLPCKFARVFPVAHYYRVETESAIVYAILVAECPRMPIGTCSIAKRCMGGTH